MPPSKTKTKINLSTVTYPPASQSQDPESYARTYQELLSKVNIVILLNADSTANNHTQEKDRLETRRIHERTRHASSIKQTRQLITASLLEL